MDIDLKKLGPYARLIKPTFTSQPQQPQPQPGPSKPYRKANFEALHKKQNVRFLQDASGKRRDRQSEMEENRKQKRTQLFMKGRKPDIGNITGLTLIADDSTCETSGMDLDCNGEIEEPKVALDSKPRVITNGNLSKCQPTNPTSRTGIGNANNVNGNLKNNINRQGLNSKATTTSNAATLAKESRREQLLKWKKEKEAADMLSRKVQKQPFKAGLNAVPAVNKNPVNTNFAKTASNLGGASSNFGSKQPNGTVQSKISRPVGPVAKVTDSTTEGRRVTRAMTKNQSLPTTTNTNSKVTTNTNAPVKAPMKPAIQKMKALNITEKQVPVKPGVGGKVAPPQTAKPTNTKVLTQKISTPSQPLGTRPNLKTNKDNQVGSTPAKSENSLAESVPEDVTSITTDNKEVQSEQQAPKKKSKPKAIDATYIDYNAKFSNACLKLKSYSSEWTNVLQEQTEIPDDIQGDINSALGAVKLLLESKLPQFGQLLYSYLCQETDPMRILGCDLEGWWDVASIQLDAVDSTFDRLTKLKANNWVKVVAGSFPPKIPQKGDGEGIKLISSRSRSKPLVKSQATGGLKAFLANKRRMLNNVDDPSMETTEIVARDEIENDDAAKSPNAHDKTFEGGFFTISSPMITKPEQTPTRRRYSRNSSVQAIPSPWRTPNRSLCSNEASHKRMSFCILGVRKSMGSINKLGAVSISAEDRDLASGNHNEGQI